MEKLAVIHCITEQSESIFYYSGKCLKILEIEVFCACLKLSCNNIASDYLDARVVLAKQ